MRRGPGRPASSLGRVKELVREGHVCFTRRGRSFVQNNYDNLDFDEIVRCVFESMSEDHYLKSVELEYLPGTYADIYRGMTYDDAAWYVKFYVDEAGCAQVVIWSLCWDGSVH